MAKCDHCITTAIVIRSIKERNDKLLVGLRKHGVHKHSAVETESGCYNNGKCVCGLDDLIK